MEEIAKARPGMEKPEELSKPRSALAISEFISGKGVPRPQQSKEEWHEECKGLAESQRSAKGAQAESFTLRSVDIVSADAMPGACPARERAQSLNCRPLARAPAPARSSPIRDTRLSHAHRPPIPLLIRPRPPIRPLRG